MRKVLKAGLVALALSMAASSAFGFEMYLESQYEATETEFSPLMAPILPLMASSARSTTNIMQVGTNNFAAAGVEGTGSVALIAQEGARNRAVQAIQGNSSALVLVQSGTDNNVLQVSNGDRNLQLVGVAGNNNNVGYIQSGSDLAGVLSVQGSNSNVVAFQNQNSANFLMPNKVSNLHNATVVIVPGRMYVFPNRR